jgi:hypothetical protein
MAPLPSPCKKKPNWLGLVKFRFNPLTLSAPVPREEFPEPRAARYCAESLSMQKLLLIFFMLALDILAPPLSAV